MEIAHHHRNISAAETHYSLPVNLTARHTRFIFEGLEWGGGSGEERWWQGWQRSVRNHYYVGKAEGSIPKWYWHLGFLTSLRNWSFWPEIFPTSSKAINALLCGHFWTGVTVDSSWLQILGRFPSDQGLGFISLLSLNWGWLSIC